MSLLSPTDKLKVRKAIANYCLRSEHSQPQIHYSQARPYHHLGVSPEHGFIADCSSFVTGTFFWAGDETNIKVLDPNGRQYDGYGYTGTLLHENIGHPVREDKKFLAGDIALYGPAYRTKHTVICRSAGMAATSVWTSHGSESGPVSVRLNYRSDLLCVLRPKSLL